MGAMESPSIRVRVDGQGRMVVPRRLRDEVLAHLPGEVVLRKTADGLLITAAEAAGTVSEGDDGLPVLSLGRPVTNEEVLRAIDAERSER